jgi:serine/threonine protein kinase
MAEVFAGHVMGSHGFQKPVAIKRLLPELASDNVFVERLIGEAKLLVSMQHGNIVSVLDLARDGEDVFLVMEYMDGPSLRQLIKARGQRGIPLGIATYIVQQAAQGLEFAHGRHVIHADISPSNLLLTTSGEVRVADFGIARREGNGAGVVEGKWAYMAPEQARGEPLTARSDVFALGVVLYELVTGKHPLGRQVTEAQRESGPISVVPPRIIKPDVPAGIDAICMRALAYDPRDRYARMQQMIDALVEERFTNGWRESASDLAALIREAAPGTGPVLVQPRTMVTDRPVTIVTRSLISSTQKTPPPAAPDAAAWAAPIPRAPTQPPVVRDADSAMDTFEAASPNSRPSLPMVPGAESGARTSHGWLDPQLMTAPELASVHGGATVTASGQIVIAPARSSKWTFGILGVAALIGVSAAIAIQMAPGGISERAEAAPPRAPVAEQTPPVKVVPVPVPVPEPVVQPAVVQAPPPAVEPAPIEPAKPAVVDEPKPAVVKKARPAPIVKKPAAPDATLRVVTDEGTWAKVIIGSEAQEAPGAKFHLAAGTYTVRLRNSDLDISMVCQVSLEAGKVKTLRVALEDKQCYGD